jgi:hypothetical protein
MKRIILACLLLCSSSISFGQCSLVIAMKTEIISCCNGLKNTHTYCFGIGSVKCSALGSIACPSCSSSFLNATKVCQKNDPTTLEQWIKFHGFVQPVRAGL